MRQYRRMGKGWKQAGMAANAAKKGAVFTKLAREIQVAAKLGGPDPNTNSRLRMAVDAAREASCPKDTIERAIKKGAGLLDDGAQIEELTYEGYGPHKVGVIVECQTDNRNRTASEIRNIFNKKGGALGAEGSVTWMFDRVCLVEGVKAGVGDPEEEAIEAGANEVEHDEGDKYAFYGNPEDLKAIETALTGRGWAVSTAELAYKAKNLTEVTDEQKKEVVDFLQLLDDNDDSHRIYCTLDM
ncbi:MAG: YebC/PmpR family DNA-binding transcriptional regulator [Bdellovibrionales bacterium]|nr:YebC/PmpR family DNA-binding transcriptional regulator [Bdellovibrionales bacterium]